MSVDPMLDVGYVTHRGRVRPRNEDNLGLPPNNLSEELLAAKGRLYLVADGMGGHEGGQRASQVASQRIVEEYYRDPSPDLQRSLDRAIRAANAEIYQEAKRTPALQKMGTTVTAAVVRGNDLLVANVGDSRTYLVRGGSLQQLTEDHSLMAQGLRDGSVTPDQVASHPYRGVITRALGSQPDVQADFFHYQLLPGDGLLLCSDGLTNEVDELQIVATIAQSRTAQEASSRLVEMANQHGGRDNITVILVGSNGPPPVAATVPVATVAAPETGTATAAAPARRVPTWLFLAAAAVVSLALVLVVVAIIYTPGAGDGTPMAMAQTTMTVEATTGAAAAVASSTGVEAAAVITGTPATGGTTATTQSADPTSTLRPSPEPTSTPVVVRSTVQVASHTPTPTSRSTDTPRSPAYPTPALLEPKEGARITHNDTVVLRWLWDGSLEPDEYYDVRVWRGGGEHLGVTWTRDLFYYLHIPSQDDRLTLPEIKGTYHWAVAVIRGENGQMDRQLSAESPSRTFYWEPAESKPPKPKPSDPTPTPPR